MEKFYIAYGSNLNVDQMRFRCPHATPVGTGVLEDYQLLFKGHRDGRFGVLTVEPHKGRQVPVGIWLVDDFDEARLDVYEGYPRLYDKEWIDLPVTLLADPKHTFTVTAMVYRMTPGHHLALPTETYFDTCEQGYRDFGFDRSVLNKAWAESFTMKGRRRFVL